MTETVTFSFGQNWQAFINQCWGPERAEAARCSLQDFLSISDLANRTFLDIGCGSGLFSLAAFNLGAARIVSFDRDPHAVNCTRQLWRSAGSPNHWMILEGSVLDGSFLSRLEPADVVYAWGSLHHTGEMWTAIRNAGQLVKSGGKFYLAIYNHVRGRRSSEYWLAVKRNYNRARKLKKRWMEFCFFLRYAAVPGLMRGRNPLNLTKAYSRRGMDYWVDVRDWLGGLPYEYASVDDVFHFCSRELQMELHNIRSTHTTGCNEFLFSRKMD